jgi:hypothetical protein
VLHCLNSKGHARTECPEDADGMMRISAGNPGVISGGLNHAALLVSRCATVVGVADGRMAVA